MRYLKTLAAFFLGCIMLSLTIEGPLFHIDQNKAFAATPTATSTATPTPTPSATPTVTLYASKDCLSGDGQRKTWCPPATQCTTGQVAVYGPGPDPGSNDIGASTCATNGGATGLQQPSAAPTAGQYLSTNSSSNPPTLIWSSAKTMAQLPTTLTGPFVSGSINATSTITFSLPTGVTPASVEQLVFIVNSGSATVSGGTCFSGWTGISLTGLWNFDSAAWQMFSYGVEWNTGDLSTCTITLSTSVSGMWMIWAHNYPVRGVNQGVVLALTSGSGGAVSGTTYTAPTITYTAGAFGGAPLYNLFVASINNGAVFSSPSVGWIIGQNNATAVGSGAGAIGVVDYQAVGSYNGIPPTIAYTPTVAQTILVSPSSAGVIIPALTGNATIPLF